MTVLIKPIRMIKIWVRSAYQSMNLISSNVAVVGKILVILLSLLLFIFRIYRRHPDFLIFRMKTSSGFPNASHIRSIWCTVLLPGNTGRRNNSSAQMHPFLNTNYLINIYIFIFFKSRMAVLSNLWNSAVATYRVPTYQQLQSNTANLRGFQGLDTIAL